ncbi:ribbon-helix-helix protein, CopG family [Marinimicrobium sp. ABcell2]|nr:ribbon-helix-helix protein, CopG family [Marinimicrobium sp. ABcell2]MDQ2075837.1 ribbon-helix-helix protein, CopG family [Marinimicrobium sp. ABcell2]
MTVRLDQDTDRLIRGLAAKDDRTVGWIVRKLIEEALDHRKKLKLKSQS